MTDHPSPVACPLRRSPSPSSRRQWVLGALSPVERPFMGIAAARTTTSFTTLLAYGESPIAMLYCSIDWPQTCYLPTSIPQYCTVLSFCLSTPVSMCLSVEYYACTYTVCAF